MGLKRVDVNSDCPKSPNMLHKWVTHSTVSPFTEKRKVMTWCDYCNAIPK